MPNSVSNGVRIYDISAAATGGSDEESLRNVEHAISILAEAAPRSLTFLRRTGLRIIIGEVSRAPAGFMPWLHAVVIDRERMLKQRPVYSAALIVHELVHVRFWRRGIRDMKVQATRVEKRCNVEMLRFIERRGDADYLVSWAKALADGAGSIH